MRPLPLATEKSYVTRYTFCARLVTKEMKRRTTQRRKGCAPVGLATIALSGKKVARFFQTMEICTHLPCVYTHSVHTASAA